MPAWFFQANPSEYNLVNSLKAGPDQVWRVSRFRDEISAGDRVYLWESGDRGGLWAVARVVGPAALMAFPDAQYRFVVGETLEQKRAKFGVDHYAPIRVERTAPPGQPIRRGTLKQHAELRALPILENPRGTNFRVAPSGLGELLERTTAAWSLPGIASVDAASSQQRGT